MVTRDGLIPCCQSTEHVGFASRLSQSCSGVSVIGRAEVGIITVPLVASVTRERFFKRGGSRASSEHGYRSV